MRKAALAFGSEIAEADAVKYDWVPFYADMYGPSCLSPFLPIPGCRSAGRFKKKPRFFKYGVRDWVIICSERGVELLKSGRKTCN